MIKEREREQAGSYDGSFRTRSPRSHTTASVLLYRSELLNLAHTQGQGTSVHLVKGGVSRNLQTYFKTTTTDSIIPIPG